MKLTLEQKCERRRKVNETAAKHLGAQVRSIEWLEVLAQLKKSVYCRGCWGLLPAVVVMNMAASQVHRAIKNREIFEYNREGK